MSIKFADYAILSAETCNTLEGLERVTSLLVDAGNARDALERIGRVLTDVLHASRWSIMLKTELDMIRINLAKGLPEHVIESTCVRWGEGIAGRVAERGQGELFSNVAYEVGTSSGGHYESTSAICVPMVLKGEVLGVINLSDKCLGQGQIVSFEPKDLTLALLAANQAALMIDMLRVREATRGHALPVVGESVGKDQALLMQASAFDLLSRVTDLMIISSSIDQVLEAVIQGACRLLGATRGSLMLFDKARAELRIRAAIGIPQAVVSDVCIRPGEGIAGRVLETGEALLITNAPQLRLGGNQPAGARDARAAQYRNQSALCVPMKIRGMVHGVFNINDRLDQADFSENDLYIARVIANQAAVAISAASLLVESVAAAELQQSLEIAHEIQDYLLPPVMTLQGFDIARLSDACATAGGDYIDYFAPDGERDCQPDRLYLACGDVSGHGVGAALIMAMGRAFLRALLWQEAALSSAFYRMNNLIEADTPSGQFMTLFVGQLDVATGHLTYASAGHEPALLYQSASDTLVVSETTGLPLGMFADQRYTLGRLELQPGDVLALPTDGLAEAINLKGEFYGRERLEQDLRELHDRPASHIVEEIKQRVLAFAQPNALRDDLSLIVVKRQ